MDEINISKGSRYSLIGRVHETVFNYCFNGFLFTYVVDV